MYPFTPAIEFEANYGCREEFAGYSLFVDGVEVPCRTCFVLAELQTFCADTGHPMDVDDALEVLTFWKRPADCAEEPPF